MELIRKMTENDWYEVSDIYREGVESGICTFTAAVPAWEKWNGSHCSDCRMVACENGRVTGWTALSHVSETPAYFGVAEVSLYVASGNKYKGTGTRLLREVMQEAEKEGYWTMEARIFWENTASIHLFKKCGFRVLGIRDKIGKKRSGEWTDTVIMEYRNQIM